LIPIARGLKFADTLTALIWRSQITAFIDFGRRESRPVFLPISPRLPATDTAPLEATAIAVLGDHVFRRERMTLFADCEFLLDHWALKAMVSRIATRFAGAFGQLSGKQPIVLRNDANKRLPEKARGWTLGVARAQDSLALLATDSLPYPATLPGLVGS